MASRFLVEKEEPPPQRNINHLITSASYDATNHKVVLHKHDTTTQDLSISTLNDHASSITTLESAGYQTSSDVDSNINARGFQTSSDVNSNINARGFQTSSDVNSNITGRGFQTSSDVNSNITGRGFQTSSDVNSNINARGYQTNSQVNATVSSTVSSTYVSSLLTNLLNNVTLLDSLTHGRQLKFQRQDNSFFLVDIPQAVTSGFIANYQNIFPNDVKIQGQNGLIFSNYGNAEVYGDYLYLNSAYPITGTWTNVIRMSNTVFCNQGLHIQSSHMTANFSNSYSDFLTNGGSVQGDPPNLSFSLTALRSIICQTLVVTSDDRIKDNIRDINDENALVQLRSIQPKIYGYKDKYEKGNIETIGFIAQQIKKVIPQAVALTRRAIPNILTPAFVHVKNDKIELKLRLPLGNDIILKNGCFIQVSIANQNYEFEFLSYSNENESIIVAIGTENINKISEGVKAVIYGEIVDDFHCIDEAQIFTITTAALQEVDRQLTAEKAKTAFLQDQMTDVLSRLALLEK